LSAEFDIAAQPRPASLLKLFVGDLEARRRGDDTIVEFASRAIAWHVQRREYAGGELTRFVQYRIDQIRRHFVATRQTRHRVESRKFLDHEPHVAQRCNVLSHSERLRG